MIYDLTKSSVENMLHEVLVIINAFLEAFYEVCKHSFQQRSVNSGDFFANSFFQFFQCVRLAFVYTYLETPHKKKPHMDTSGGPMMPKNVTKQEMRISEGEDE